IINRIFDGVGGAKDVHLVVCTADFLDGEHTFRLQVGDRVKFTDLSSADVGDHLDKRASHTATVNRLLLAVLHGQNDPVGGYINITNVVPRSPNSDIHIQIRPISRFCPVEEASFEWDQASADAFWAASRPTVMVHDIKYPSVRTKINKYTARDGRLLFSSGATVNLTKYFSLLPHSQPHFKWYGNRVCGVRSGSLARVDLSNNTDAGRLEAE
ncbi:hypothetical protein OC861_004571, partial [Tilletia horrida]